MHPQKPQGPFGVILYTTSTSSIIAAYSVSSYESLLLFPLDQSTQSIIQVSANHPAIKNIKKYKISNGQLVEKNVVTLTASANSFPADGTSTVDLTFAGLNASATVQVGGQSVTVSPADNVVTLSSDTPQAFTVQLVDTDQWSNPVTVEAQ